MDFRNGGEAAFDDLVEQALARAPGNIREFRELLGMSQAAFAERLSVDPTTAYRLERGLTLPSFKTVLALHLLSKEKGLRRCVFDTAKRCRPIGF